jgi:hypothetical protein
VWLFENFAEGSFKRQNLKTIKQSQKSPQEEKLKKSLAGMPKF